MRAQVCVATVALLVGSIMAGQAASVLAAGWRLLAAVAALHAGAPRSCSGFGSLHRVKLAVGRGVESATVWQCNTTGRDGVRPRGCAAAAAEGTQQAEQRMVSYTAPPWAAPGGRVFERRLKGVF
jgi:hypothetical protein